MWSHRWTCAFLLFLVTVPASAQDEWIGRRFVAKEGATFKVGSQEVPHERILTPFTVTQVNGDWLWTGRAWVHKRYVVPIENAAAYYTEYLRNNPTNSAVYSNRGNVWQEEGKLDKALEDYTEAIRLDPKLVTAYNSRGTLWEQTGELDKAMKDYDEAIRLDPKYAVA